MKQVIHMLITLTIIGVVSGAALSQLSNWAKPKIAMHRAAELQQAIFLVQPDAKSFEKIESELESYEVYDEAKDLIGYALPYDGSGYQGNIRVMIGVSKDMKEIVGIEILEQLETPGLGTKIAEEPYKGQYNGLSADPNVIYVKGESPDQPNEIQTITGATISSVAVVDIVNAGIEHLRSIQKQGGGN